MGPTKVLDLVHQACPPGMPLQEKQAWVDAHAQELRNHIKSYKVLQRSLHVIVVGGGIGGLTAAIALYRAGGIKVTVLEQAPPPGLRELGLGFHLSPNVTKILYGLGLDKEINAKGQSMAKFEKFWTDGEYPRAATLIKPHATPNRNAGNKIETRRPHANAQRSCGFEPLRRCW